MRDKLFYNEKHHFMVVHKIHTMGSTRIGAILKNKSAEVEEWSFNRLQMWT